MVKLWCFENKMVGNLFYKLLKCSGDFKVNLFQVEIDIVMFGIMNL